MPSEVASYETVVRFLSPDDEPLEVSATVIDRGDEMVLSIPKQAKSYAYNVLGKRVGHFYAGIDDLQDPKPVDVVARWSLLGDVFVGIWVEDGGEYLFCFRRPRQR